MDSTPTPGINSTEFIVMVALAFIAVILAGLNVTGGVPDFHPDKDLLDKLFDVGMIYVGGRTALKGVHAYSASRLPTPSPAPPPPPSPAPSPSPTPTS